MVRNYNFSGSSFWSFSDCKGNLKTEKTWSGKTIWKLFTLIHSDFSSKSDPLYENLPDRNCTFSQKTWSGKALIPKRWTLFVDLLVFCETQRQNPQTAYRIKCDFSPNLGENDTKESSAFLCTKMKKFNHLKQIFKFTPSLSNISGL